MQTTPCAARSVPRLLRGEGTPTGSVCLVGAACGRPLDAPDERGHAAPDAVLPRTRGAARAPDDDESEGVPDTGHRRRRPRHVPPDLLRDARQLLVRAVLQAGCDRARDRVHTRADAARLGSHLGDRARRRSAARGSARTRSRSSSGRSRDARRANRAASELRELLVGRRPRALWARLGDLLGLG